jgi:hypothetical protein
LTVLVCGDRNWRRYTTIRDRLAQLPPGTTIRHGGCRGADQMAGIAARALGFEVEEFPADWGSHGRAAGPRRNRQMAATQPVPGLAIAFHENLMNSAGTLDMVRVARRSGIPTEVIS